MKLLNNISDCIILAILKVAHTILVKDHKQFFINLTDPDWYFNRVANVAARVAITAFILYVLYTILK
jgi:hypothetical protein